MPLTREQMNRKIDEHFRFEAADDIDGVVTTLAPDAVHDIVGWPSGPTRGRDNARPFYNQLFADLAEGAVTPIKRLYGDNFLIDESLWEGRAPGRPFGLDGRNRPLKFRLLHVVEFTDDAQIAREQVWIDMAAVVRQLTQD